MVVAVLLAHVVITWAAAQFRAAVVAELAPLAPLAVIWARVAAVASHAVAVASHAVAACHAPAVYRVQAAHHVPAAATAAVLAPVAATAAVHAPVAATAVAAVAVAQVAAVAAMEVRREAVDIVAKPSLINTNTHVSFSIS